MPCHAPFFTLLFLSLWPLLAPLANAQAAKSPQRQTAPEVFAFCYDTHDAQKRDLVQQAKMLQQLGFDGAGHIGLDNIDQRLKSLDDCGLRCFLAGVTIDLRRDVEPQLVALRNALPLLKGRRVVIYTVVTGLPPGTPEGMDDAMAAVRRVSELASSAELRVGIYPHTGDWVATVPQAVALARRVERDNCGIVFNLCHFLRNESLESLDEVLRMAAPHLVAVTINGADLAGRDDKDWKRLILPLDQGNFDLASLCEKLAQCNYTGPIGIMCYGIGGDAQEHLSRSIAAWRKLTEKSLRER